MSLTNVPEANYMYNNRHHNIRWLLASNGGWKVDEEIVYSAINETSRRYFHIQVNIGATGTTSETLVGFL